MKTPRLAPLRERASCAKCEFASMTPNNDRLFHCRRRAPISNPAFPIVNESDWCGDFREELNA